MAVTAGQEVEVLIEKPASGGRMIARHEGEVLLVAGAIPGERVAAVVTRAEKRVAFADTARVIEASPDRREARAIRPAAACLYVAHRLRPPGLGSRQKSFAMRIAQDRPHSGRGRDRGRGVGRAWLPHARPISCEDGRPGFYREGTHELCDPRQTGQLPRCGGRLGRSRPSLRSQAQGDHDRVGGAVREHGRRPASVARGSARRRSPPVTHSTAPSPPRG